MNVDGARPFKCLQRGDRNVSFQGCVADGGPGLKPDSQHIVRHPTLRLASTLSSILRVRDGCSPTLTSTSKECETTSLLNPSTGTSIVITSPEPLTVVQEAAARARTIDGKAALGCIRPPNLSGSQPALANMEDCQRHGEQGRCDEDHPYDP